MLFPNVFASVWVMTAAWLLALNASAGLVYYGSLPPPPNVPPVVDLDGDENTGPETPLPARFVEGQGAVALAGENGFVRDADGRTLAWLTATIENPLDGPKEVLQAGTEGTGLEASFDTATGTLLITGEQKTSVYQSVLRSVCYNNLSQAPRLEARKVRFTAFDGQDQGQSAVATVTIVSVNAAPRLDLDADDSQVAGTGFATTFVGNKGPVLIVDNDAVLSDPDNPTLSRLSATITNPEDGAAERLDANSANTLIQVAFDDGTGTLTLSGEDKLDNYQRVLRTITYSNAATSITPGVRTVTLLADDGTEASEPAVCKLTVEPGNLPPTVDLDADDSTQAGADFVAAYAGAGEPIGLADTDATLADPDSTTLSSLTATLLRRPDGKAEILSADTSGTAIHGDYDTTEGCLRLTGFDTVNHYQQVLRSLTYSNQSLVPQAGPRAIEVVANDGKANSDVVRADVQVPNTRLAGSVLVLVLVTSDLSAEDDALCGELAAIAQRYADDILGGAVLAIGAEEETPRRWTPGQAFPGNFAPIKGEDFDVAFRQGFAVVEWLSAKVENPDFVTVLVWKSEHNPDDEEDLSKTVRVPADRTIYLIWFGRMAGDRASQRLSYWFEVEPFERRAGDDETGEPARSLGGSFPNRILGVGGDGGTDKLLHYVGWLVHSAGKRNDGK